MRPIDADALMESIENIRWFHKAKNGVLVEGATSNMTSYLPTKDVHNAIKSSPTIEATQAITGDTSDGYHTFNELYHHRAVLFSVIVKAFPDKAWKAVKHHDGTMYDGMFIVGIDTSDGQATYHYNIEPYWNMFECKELEYAPEWDGHTPDQAIERIGKLKPFPDVHGKIERQPEEIIHNLHVRPILCKNCGTVFFTLNKSSKLAFFCPYCGAKFEWM